MRYFFVADIHGEYSRLINALKEAGFNKDQDILVSLGDPFDRGPQNYEVLEFLLSCPNRILIWGNHDARLAELIQAKMSFHSHDLANGTIQTIFDLGYRYFYIDDLEESARLLRNCGSLNQYFKECVFAAEFEDFIATHAWVPNHDAIWNFDVENKVIYRPRQIDWREADLWTWNNITWSTVSDLIKNNLFPDKTLIIGHWHAARLRNSPYFNPASHKTFFSDKLIGLDGCVNLEEGVMNIYVLETDIAPTLYGKGFFEELRKSGNAKN